MNVVVQYLLFVCVPLVAIYRGVTGGFTADTPDHQTFLGFLAFAAVAAFIWFKNR